MKAGHFFLLSASALCASPPTWTDVTAAVGLEGKAYSRVKFADLNHDFAPDVILVPDRRNNTALPPEVFLLDAATGTYQAVEDTGLPRVVQGDVLVFTDLDNDGHRDAVVGRYLDLYQDHYTPPLDAPTRTGWLPGHGDGTFGAPQEIPAARLATTRAVAVGDVNEDGWPDLWLGNWYERYFSGYECFANGLLLQHPGAEGHLAFTRWPLPHETSLTSYDRDLGGRATYGVALPKLHEGLPMLLELNYGRRWNRLYQLTPREHLRIPPGADEPPSLVLRDPRAQGEHLVRQLHGADVAPEAGVDGDHIRHGRHPSWPLRHASAVPRSTRPDEPPFRANGNEFDAAVGDIDNDGDFDLFITTIIHAWAGESSDRSRFLVNQLEETGQLRFESFARLSVDRMPPLPEAGEPLQEFHTRANQGDIYAELADLNHDGRLDLILCASDYADVPPYEERLRLYYQQIDGRFRDMTAALGLDHVGAGMPSLADIDADGDLDLLIGQSFNRLTRAQRREAALTSGAISADAPEDARLETRMRLFRNDSTAGRGSIVIHLQGDPAQGITREAFGTVLALTADLDGNPETESVRQIRQVLGPGGHAGKQNTFAVHFGLGEATQGDLSVTWPGKKRAPVQFKELSPGRYVLDATTGNLSPL